MITPLTRDWRYALPCWLHDPAIAIICVDRFLFSGKANLWTPAGVLMAASRLAAGLGWLAAPVSFPFANHELENGV